MIEDTLTLCSNQVEYNKFPENSIFLFALRSPWTGLHGPAFKMLHINYHMIDILLLSIYFMYVCIIIIIICTVPIFNIFVPKTHQCKVFKCFSEYSIFFVFLIRLCNYRKDNYCRYLKISTNEYYHDVKIQK